MLYGDSMLGRFTRPRIAALEASVEAALAADGAPYSVMVLNCAAGGWNSAHSARRGPVMARCTPAVVVLSVGMNDCVPGRLVPLDAFARNVASIRAAFIGAGLVGFLPPMVRETGHPATAPDTGAEAATSEADLPPGRRNVVLDRYRDVLRDAAGALWSLDTPGLLARRPDLEPLEEDGIHLTAQAYDMLIPELARLIAAALTSTPTGREGAS
ncbi:SGNH/GDSL hydrolase family protein [Myceligenerans pegani]|nr:GDSL-type esterase/lipase family protein [Myceligenerans sp. TRM 65318]